MTRSAFVSGSGGTDRTAGKGASAVSQGDCLLEKGQLANLASLILQDSSEVLKS